MSTFMTPLSELVVFEELKSELSKRTGIHVVRGCMESQKTHMIFGLGDGFSQKVIVCSDEQKAKRVRDEYRFFASGKRDSVRYYPPRDLLFYQADIRGNEIARERMEAVRAILEDEDVTVVTTIDAFFDHLPEPADLYAERIELKESDVIDLADMEERLVRIGYERTPQVDQPGQFAVRGGILDVFALTQEQPWRLEFWGDEIDSIRVFDVESQRSLMTEESIVIYPVSDTFFGEKTATFLDYFDKDKCAFFLDEPNRLKERADFIEQEYAESVANRLEKGYLEKGEAEVIATLPEVAQALASRHCAALCTLDLSRDLWRTASSHFVETKTAGVYRGNFRLLLGDLERFRKEKYRIALLCGSRSRAKRLAGELFNESLNAFYSEDMEREIQPGEIYVTYGRTEQGYAYPSIRFLVIAESDIFGREQKKKRVRPKYAGERIQSFSDLKSGDYVVHESHGLGIYRGIEKIEVDRVVKDYMKVEYDRGDNLYIPATGLDLLQKYTGGGEKPRLNRLGTSRWEKTKTKTRGAVKEIAQELVDLYAARQQKAGFSYSPDTVWQREFEELFEYEETEDQLLAIEDTKRDMESRRIMDRLICGDVGYGKTEIAIRAAFKAVQDNKQVAVLVPTTILAEQHYRTFAQRMKDYPVRVDLLCRFRTAAEQKKTIADIRKGAVDIVIGTHRLLSKDVQFKDLGLLVIDEEQRFGVAHKEKIKQMRNSVDVLTLSATPIPRTLHMSLVGIRDMSVLEEAPTDRLPIQTYVMEYNEETVREAINRELGRGGQVYFVYNRVDTIADMTAFLRRLVPGARIVSAHGQMPERDLEQVMVDFIHGDADVLVSTTIVENGLDIANVNTMIIFDADTFGLSQLYQLRGRIGRSNRTSYAFFMYRKNKILRETAEKRLAAIREFTELGSGFKIAMRDLEIRGAGNLLGAKQHGHMEAVGYDLYCKMLNEAVRHLKGEIEEKTFETSVDLMVDAYIPSEYIQNENQKLSVYKRIAQVETEEEKQDMTDELIDRFGEPPACVMNLLRVAGIKALAHSLSLTGIEQKGDEYRFVFYEKADLDPTDLPVIIREADGDLTFRMGKSPILTYRKKKHRKGESAEDPFEVAESVLSRIKGLLPGEK